MDTASDPRALSIDTTSETAADPAALPQIEVPVPARTPLLERVGVRYFVNRSARRPKAVAVDALHVLNPEERAALRRIERNGIVAAAISGAIASAIAGLAEVLAGPLPEAASLDQKAVYWAIVGGATIVSAVGEIAFLNWNGLRSVHELAHATGLDLTSPGPVPALAGALARAALELPNPAAPVFGIDPRREASRLGLILAGLAYKAKVSLTNFVIKALVRRALGRAAVRAVLAFVAVPVTALWNGVVCWRVLRQARLRAMGPSAAHALITHSLGAAPLSAAGKLAALRAVGSIIVSKRDMHPNLLFFLAELRGRLGEKTEEMLDQPALLLRDLRELPAAEKKVALRILASAAVLDGRLTRREQKLLREALLAAGCRPELEPIQRLRQAFIYGEEPAPLIEAIG